MVSKLGFYLLGLLPGPLDGQTNQQQMNLPPGVAFNPQFGQVGEEKDLTSESWELGNYF